MPGTWRAQRASDPVPAIPVTASSAGTGVPAARWPQMKVDRARRSGSRGTAGSAARPRAKLVTKFLQDRPAGPEHGTAARAAGQLPGAAAKIVQPGMR